MEEKTKITPEEEALAEALKGFSDAATTAEEAIGEKTDARRKVISKAYTAFLFSANLPRIYFSQNRSAAWLHIADLRKRFFYRPRIFVR